MNKNPKDQEYACEGCACDDITVLKGAALPVICGYCQTKMHPVILPGAAQNNGGSTPGQYDLPPEAKEIQDLIEFRKMNFAVGNIFKAAYRLGIKKGVTPEYDLNKIIYFATRELKRISVGGNVGKEPRAVPLERCETCNRVKGCMREKPPIYVSCGHWQVINSKKFFRSRQRL